MIKLEILAMGLGCLLLFAKPSAAEDAFPFLRKI